MYIEKQKTMVLPGSLAPSRLSQSIYDTKPKLAYKTNDNPAKNMMAKPTNADLEYVVAVDAVLFAGAIHWGGPA